MKNFPALVALLSVFALAPLTQAQEDPNGAAAPAAPSEGAAGGSQYSGTSEPAPTHKAKRASRKAKRAAKRAKKAGKHGKKRHHN